MSIEAPVHPGIHLMNTYIERLGMSVTQAAKYLGVSRVALIKFTKGQTTCSPAMARRIAIATGTKIEYWLDMQSALISWEMRRTKPPNVVIFPFDETFLLTNN